MDIVLSTNLSLVRIKNEIGEYKLKAILFILIQQVIDFFSVGRTMSVSQINTTIELLLETYSIYKIDDFKLCFKKAMLGEYGVTYDRIDGVIIFSWFDRYIIERNDAFEKQRVKEKIEFSGINIESSPKDVPMPEWFKEWLEQWKKDRLLNNINKIDRVLNQTEEQAKYSRLLKEFHDLWVIQGATSGLRFVKIEDKFLDSYEYLQWRIKNEV